MTSETHATHVRNGRIPTSASNNRCVTYLTELVTTPANYRSWSTTRMGYWPWIGSSDWSCKFSAFPLGKVLKFRVSRGTSYSEANA